MSMNGGNRSVTERLDTALYDKVKQMQKMFAELIRVNIFNEILLEGGFDPVVNPYSDSISDRCYFKFNEIDVDTQVKKETHVVQKFVNSMITLPEARKELGIDPEYDKDQLFTALQANIQTQMQIDVQSGRDAQMDSDKQQSSTGGSSNLPNRRRGPGNTIRPANQQGRKTSPDIKRSDSNLLSLVENLLEEEYTVIYSEENESE